MIFGEVYNFYVCKNLEGQLNRYIRPKQIIDYEEAKSTKFYYNKMNYIPMLGDVDDISGDVNNVFPFQCWDSDKITRNCKETLLDADPSIGNRMVASPVLIKRVDLDPDTTDTDKEACYLSIKHIDSQAIQFVSYDSGTRKVTVRMLDAELDEVAPEDILLKEFVLSAQSPLDEDSLPDGTKTMLNGIKVKFDSRVDEFTGFIDDITDIDTDANTIAIKLSTVPSVGDINKFVKLILVSPKNQRMYVLPLGTVRDKVDSCPLRPKDVLVSPILAHWNYMMPHASFTTTPTYGLIPAMKCEFPDNGNIVKLIIFVIRDRIISESSSGFLIEPYVYGV